MYVRTCLKGPWVWSICFPCTYASMLKLIWLLCLTKRWLSVQYVCTNTYLALVNDSSSVQLDQQQKSHAERMKKKNIQITGLQKVSKLSHFSTRCGMLVTWYCVQLSWSQTPEGIHTYLCLNSHLWIQLTAHSVLLIVATSYSHVHFLWTPLCNVSSLPPLLPLSLFSYACVGAASHCSQAGGHCYAVKGSGRKEIRGSILVDEA